MKCRVDVAHNIGNQGTVKSELSRLEKLPQFRLKMAVDATPINNAYGLVIIDK